MATILKHTLQPPDGLIECDSVIDVGAGIRPFAWYEPARHICIEPSEVYAEILENEGFDVVRGKAIDVLGDMSADAVYLLDVIEHMDFEEGWDVLKLAKKVAERQVVVYTPVGFQPQEGDAWGLGQDEWQKHRSGWIPEDFPGWRVQRIGGKRGFFAIWDA